MNTNKILDKINDAVEDAIRPIIAKGASMTAAELDVLNKAVCTLDKIKQIESSSGNYDDGNSFEEYLRNSYNSYDDGNSYRRGRSPITGRYVSRDAMPYSRYYDPTLIYDTGASTRRYYDGAPNHNGYSGHGYSGHSRNDMTIYHIENLIDAAQTEQERQFLSEWLRRVKNN